MRKLVLALVAAFGLGTFAGVAQAGGGCSYTHGIKTTATPISSPIETTATTKTTEQTPG